MSKKDNNLLSEAYDQIYSNIVEEAKKAKKDYDGDGRVESPEDEYKGSKDKAIKMAKGKKGKKKVNEQVEHLKEATFALIEAVKCLAKKDKKDKMQGKKPKRVTTGTGAGEGTGV
jgi:hypothetical protein